MIAPRLAPTAARVAISRFRASARESNRLATLAQAISRTTRPLPTEIKTFGRTSPTTSSRRPSAIITVLGEASGRGRILLAITLIQHCQFIVGFGDAVPGGGAQ